MSALYMVAMLIASTMAWEYNCVEGVSPVGPYVTCAAGEKPIVLCVNDGCVSSSGYYYGVADVMSQLDRS